MFNTRLSESKKSLVIDFFPRLSGQYRTELHAMAAAQSGGCQGQYNTWSRWRITKETTCYPVHGWQHDHVHEAETGTAAQTEVHLPVGEGHDGQGPVCGEVQGRAW